MCERIQPDNLTGLAFFPLVAEKSTFQKVNYSLGLQKLVDSAFLKEIGDTSVICSEIKNILQKNEFTTSLGKIDSLLISATVEYKNYFGVRFNPELSGNEGLKIFKNFFDICSTN